MTDFRTLCAELLSHIDYLNEEHWLPGSIYADHARAALAQPEPPADGDVAELVAALKNDAECVEAEHYDLCNMTAEQMRRAADLLDRLAQPEPQGPSDEELIRMAENAGFAYEHDGGLFNSHTDSFDIKLEVLSFARAVWGSR